MSPNDVGIKNGRFFGFDYSIDQAEVVVVTAPWDVTTSYRPGTRLGPASILEASPQLDFTSSLRPKAWETKIGSFFMPEHWLDKNSELRPYAEKVIGALESGAEPNLEWLRLVNEGCEQFHSALELAVDNLKQKNKFVVTVGGDHSVSLGPIKAVKENFSLLHIDAHADLRLAYEGFTHSHASIMRNVHDRPNLERLVQVGLRDVAPSEQAYSAESKKIISFTEYDLRRGTASGKTWDEQCKRIVGSLGSNVYVSVDIDGLDPKYCPNTGTPVPGGLEWWEFQCLLETLVLSGRKVIGADLVEVAPGKDTDWDANVGARVLFQLCQLFDLQ